MLVRFLIFICLIFSFTFCFGVNTTKKDSKQETIKESVKEDYNSFNIFLDSDDKKYGEAYGKMMKNKPLNLIDNKEVGRLYDMEFPKSETFTFDKHELRTKGVYALYTMNWLYFVVGSRVYGPVYDSKTERWTNKWLKSEDFQKIAQDEDYETYYFGDVPYIQLKKFHIFWLTCYNNKRFKETASNENYFTDILLKMTNYKIKYYFMSEGKRVYVKTRQIMKNTKQYFPPVKEVYEGEFL